MVGAVVSQLSARVDITGGIGTGFNQSLREARRNISLLQAQSVKIQADLTEAETHARSFGNAVSQEAIDARRNVTRLRFALADTSRQLEKLVNQADGMERLQRGFRTMTGAAIGFAAGFGGLSLLANQRLNQVQELAQSQLEAGIRSAEAIQRARRATNALGLDIFAGDEIIKEIGKEGKKKAAEAVVDPGSEQAKRIRQFITDRTAADLLEQANTNPEQYALFVLETLQRVSTEQGPAQAGLLAEVLAGETGGDYAAGLINAGMFGQFLDVYRNATVLSEEQVASTRRLTGALSRLAYSFGQLVDSIGAAIEPVFGPLLHMLASALDWVTRLFAENQEFATWLSVAGVAGFLAFSVAVGIASLSFFQLWVSSLFATGGVTTSGIAAAVASGSWWSLATAIWAATWPILAILALVAAAVVGFYYLQRRLGGVKEAFFQLRDGIILALSPLFFKLTGILYLIEGIIKLINLIPGVDIGTGALEDVRSVINPIAAGQRTVDRFSSPTPGGGDDDTDNDTGAPGPSASPFSLPPALRPGGGISPEFPVTSPAPAVSAPTESPGYQPVVFNTENNFYGDNVQPAEEIADDIEEKITNIPGRPFKRV